MLRLYHLSILFLVGLLLLATGCSQQGSVVVLPKGVPVVRVRLMQDKPEILVAATQTVYVKSAADMTPQAITFPRIPGSSLKLAHGTWVAGGIPLGTGELTLTPTSEGTMTVDAQQYRGRMRLVPVTLDTFDVINDVDVEGYLKSVLSKELLSSWDDETYKAQAIAARTYAIYEARMSGTKRYWDVYPDQRSQVYGGMSFETSKSTRAVEATRGVVVAFGPPGQERIFKAYFSSCCGGRTQSAYDAFGDEYTLPLSEQNRGATCNVSTKFNWGPVTIRKDEIARRIQAWAKRKTAQEGKPRPELNMQGVASIRQAYENKVKRPVWFYVVDNQNMQYLMRAEDLRSAIASEANGGPTVYSGYFNTDNSQPGVIRFIDGHGFGHGVGLCQWCAQREALSGWRHEDIVVTAYPGSKLIRAY